MSVTEGRTSRGCLWRLLDNGCFGYDCKADDAPCPEQAEITEIEAVQRARHGDYEQPRGD